MKKIFSSICMAAALGSLAGCAHLAGEKQIDTKLEQTAPVSNRGELGTKATDLIASSDSLTAEQKAKLTELRRSVAVENEALIKQSLQLRSLLIGDLMSPNYNRDEVNLLQRRLKSVETKRLDLVFDSVRKANSIMGRQASSGGAILNSMVQIHEHGMH